MFRFASIDNVWVSGKVDNDIIFWPGIGVNFTRMGSLGGSLPFCGEHSARGGDLGPCPNLQRYQYKLGKRVGKWHPCASCQGKSVRD